MQKIMKLQLHEHVTGGYYYRMSLLGNLDIEINILDEQSILEIFFPIDILNNQNYLIRSWKKIKNDFSHAILGKYSEHLNYPRSYRSQFIIYGAAIVCDTNHNAILQYTLDEMLILTDKYKLLDKIHLSDDFIFCAKETAKRNIIHKN